jgi:hypothetical protein
VAIFGEVPDLVARHHDLEDTAVYLPVAELQRAPLVHSQVGDVQPVAQVVEHDARLASVGADRPGLPQRIDVVDGHLLAPVADGRGEAVVLGWRGGGEQRDVAVGGTHAGLVGRPQVRRHQPVPHALPLP